MRYTGLLLLQHDERVEKMTTDFKVCSIDGCGGTYRIRRGWCYSHYSRWLRHGDPHGGGSKLYFTPEDAFAARTEWQGDCLVWTSTAKQAGYGVLQVDGALMKAHRYAWQRVHGPLSPDEHIDHMCHNTACCNVNHLRIVTHSENMYNRAGASKNSRSGYRNVTWSKGAKKWQVAVTKDRKQHYFGLFEDIEEAVKVAADARRQLFKEYAGRS